VTKNAIFSAAKLDQTLNLDGVPAEPRDARIDIRKAMLGNMADSKDEPQGEAKTYKQLA